MTWTYSGDPSSSPEDTVRFLVGDTDSDEPKISDEEIAFLLVEWEDTYAAAAEAAQHLAATAASWLSYTADGNTLALSDAQAKYEQLADDLRAQRNRRNRTVFYVGGIDRADVEAHENDESVVHTDFGTGMHDNTWEGVQGGTTKKDLLGGPW